MNIFLLEIENMVHFLCRLSGVDSPDTQTDFAKEYILFNQIIARFI